MIDLRFQMDFYAKGKIQEFVIFMIKRCKNNEKDIKNIKVPLVDRCSIVGLFRLSMVIDCGKP